MPNPTTYTPAAREAFASAPTAEIILETLEFNHPAFTEPLRVVADTYDLKARIEDGSIVDFMKFAFRITLPEINRRDFSELRITLDSVTQELVRQLEGVKGSSSLIKVIYRPYLQSKRDAEFTKRADMNATLTDTITITDSDVPQDSKPQLTTPYQFILTEIHVTETQVSATASFDLFLQHKSAPSVNYTSDVFPELRRR